MESSNKNDFKFFCEKCNFKCMKSSNLQRHLSTIKHIRLNDNNNQTCFIRKYTCNCGKEYKYRQSLHCHKKQCSNMKNNNDKNSDSQLEKEEINSRSLSKKDYEIINTLFEFTYSYDQVKKTNNESEMIKFIDNNLNNMKNEIHKIIEKHR